MKNNWRAFAPSCFAHDPPPPAEVHRDTAEWATRHVDGQAKLLYAVEVEGEVRWLEWDEFTVERPGKRRAGKLNTNPRD